MFRNSATELHEKFLTGELSAKEITTYFLKRIDQLDPKIHAFLHVLPERALKKAEELDKKRKEKKPLGKLAAVPLAIKDILHIKGEITTCGSKFLTNYRALFDATSVRLLEEEDAIILGKTNLDEFAMGSSTENSAFFPTKNPWDLSCVPGGSSGGSAAAIAARLSLLAIGTDIGGSIRQPAAFCGIVGFKPTYGRVSRYGLVSFCSSMDCVGPMTTCVKDAALMMEVLGKPCSHDSTSLTLPPDAYISHLSKNLKGVKIGIPWSFLKNLKPDVLENFKQSVEKLKSLQAQIVDIDLNILKYSISTYYILAPAEASTNLARFDGIRYGIRSKKAKTLDEVYKYSREEGFGAEVKKRIMLGTYVLSEGFKDAYYKKGQKVRTLIVQAYEKAFETCDLVALPVTPSTAFPLHSISDPLEMYHQDLFTLSPNLAGLPAISVPSGFDHEKKPFGLQLIGPQLHDMFVIKAAYAFEQIEEPKNNIPSLFSEGL